MDFDQLLTRPPLQSPRLSVIVQCATSDWRQAVELASTALKGRVSRDEIILCCPSLEDLPPAYVRERRIKYCSSSRDDNGLSSAIALSRNPVVVTLSDRCPLSAGQLDDMVHRLALADICVATRQARSGWLRRPIDTLWRVLLGIPVQDPLSGTVAFRRVLIERILLVCKTELVWLEIFAKATYAVCLFDEVQIHSPTGGGSISQLLWHHPTDARALVFPKSWLKEDSPRGWMNEVAAQKEQKPIAAGGNDVAFLSRFSARGSRGARRRTVGHHRFSWEWKPRRLGP